MTFCDTFRLMTLSGESPLALAAKYKHAIAAASICSAFEMDMCTSERRHASLLNVIVELLIIPSRRVLTPRPYLRHPLAIPWTADRPLAIPWGGPAPL